MAQPARPVLQGSQIKLRVVTYADLPNVTAWLTKKKHFAPFHSLASYSKDEVKGRFSKGKFDNWFVISDPRGEQIGLMMYYRTAKTDSLSIGLNIAVPSARAKGYGFDAALTCMRYMFAHYHDIRFVYTETDGANAPMRRILEKLGFASYKVYTGPSRTHDMPGSKVYYSVTRERFEELHGPVPLEEKNQG